MGVVSLGNTIFPEVFAATQVHWAPILTLAVWPKDIVSQDLNLM